MQSKPTRYVSAVSGPVTLQDRLLSVAWPTTPGERGWTVVLVPDSMDVPYEQRQRDRERAVRLEGALDAMDPAALDATIAPFVKRPDDV
jgi:hypothetical protein